MKLIKKVYRKLQHIYARSALSNSHYCVLCDRQLSMFLPYRGGSKNRNSLMKALNVVGSDVDNFTCPHCSCHDRERHLFLYMNELGIIEQLAGKKILHIAPETELSKKIAESLPERYIKADLFPERDQIQKVDLMNTPFEDDYFDFVICNHVLEHVDDLERALSEIRRVLKVGGSAILQVPYCKNLKDTFSDAGIDTPEARSLAYGQEDHRRLFGSNVSEVIESTGLVSELKFHNDLLKHIQPSIYGVNAQEPLFLFRKR